MQSCLLYPKQGNLFSHVHELAAVGVRLSTLSDIEEMRGGQSEEYSPLKDAKDASVGITFCSDNSRTDALHAETRK